MHIPYLMPHQLEAFNGDQFIEREFLRLRDRFGIETAIETGTCFGATTAFLARHFKRVITLENKGEYLEIAQARLGPMGNVYTYLGDSHQILGSVLEKQGPFEQPVLFYLDAHWDAHCPLIDELQIIAGMGMRPVIAIHNVQVPGHSGLAFDSYHGQPFTYAWLRPALENIFGPDGYDHYYNSEHNSMAVKVGMLYVTPGVATRAVARSTTVTPRQTRLFVNFYNDRHPGRQEEINECLRRNCDNPLIDKVYAVVDRPETDFYGLDASHKVEKISSPGIPTYSWLFGQVNDRCLRDDIIILTNVDIYFQQRDMEFVRNYLDAAMCFALTRWERSADGRLELFDREDSQDCWMFRGPLRHIPRCDFTMGRPGCDNAIAQRIATAGYRIVNPARSIRAIHVHNTGVRRYNSYDPRQIVDQPYMKIGCSPVEELPVVNWVTQLTPDQSILHRIFENIGTTNGVFTHWFEAQVPEEPDYLDLSAATDFDVLKQALSFCKPRCCCTGFNGGINPMLSVVLRNEAEKSPSFDFSFGAVKKLLEEFGFRVIAQFPAERLFAVRQELVQGLLFNIVATPQEAQRTNPSAIWEAY